MTLRVVYLVDETLEHPVLQSQTLAVMSRLADAGVVMDLLIANGAGAAREEEIARSYLGAGPRIRVVSRRHRGLGALAKAQRALRRALARRRAAGFIRETASAAEAVVLHARGSAVHLGAYLRARFGGTRLLADVRGDAAAEARFNIGGETGERRAEMVDRMEGRALSRADHVLCVSKALLSETRRRFAVSCPATVIPCVADERRFLWSQDRHTEGRASLGLASEPLLVYAGSIGQWHRFDATLDAFQAVARRDLRARFLVATREAEKASALVAGRAELRDRTLVRRGTADEVARWLNAADVGLLLRDPHPLNRVACPTKFAEYVLSGLSVVTSDEIGDLGTWVRDLDLGGVVRGADAQAAGGACLGAMARGADRLGRIGRAAPLLSMGARLRDWLEAYRSAVSRVAPEGE
ncbi:MAG: glycosyltransferase [Vicinamibacteria bacterium]|nr:glycosyltransferase [Vicinamibacteria bacterium]